MPQSQKDESWKTYIDQQWVHPMSLGIVDFCHVMSCLKSALSARMDGVFSCSMHGPCCMYKSTGLEKDACFKL